MKKLLYVVTSTHNIRPHHVFDDMINRIIEIPLCRGLDEVIKGTVLISGGSVHSMAGKASWLGSIPASPHFSR